MHKGAIKFCVWNR